MAAGSGFCPCFAIATKYSSTGKSACIDPCAQPLGSPDQTHLSPASRSKCPLEVVSYKLLSTSQPRNPLFRTHSPMGDAVTNTAGVHPTHETISALFSQSPSHPGTMERYVQLLPPQLEAKGVRKPLSYTPLYALGQHKGLWQITHRLQLHTGKKLFLTFF